jgi:hypothetical protein
MKYSRAGTPGDDYPCSENSFLNRRLVLGLLGAICLGSFPGCDKENSFGGTGPHPGRAAAEGGAQVVTAPKIRLRSQASSVSQPVSSQILSFGRKSLDLLRHAR